MPALFSDKIKHSNTKKSQIAHFHQNHWQWLEINTRQTKCITDLVLSHYMRWLWLSFTKEKSVKIKFALFLQKIVFLERTLNCECNKKVLGRFDCFFFLRRPIPFPRILATSNCRVHLFNSIYPFKKGLQRRLFK